MNAEFEASRLFWERARDFPPDKEAPEVYGRAHTEAHEFDRHGGRRILEYGCGGGSDTLSYLRRGCEVTYVDIVPANVNATTLRIAKAIDPRLPHGHPIVLEASAPLPFHDRSFDVVSAHGVLHHISSPSPVVAEFFRVLRPGGFVYVMLYTESLYARCKGAVGTMVNLAMSREQAFGAITDGSGCPYARPYTEAEGRALLEETGFVVERAFVYNDGDFRTFRGRKP